MGDLLQLIFICYSFFVSFSEPTKVNRKFLEDGTKVRVSKKTGQVIEKPAALFDRLPRSVGECWCYFYFYESQGTC
jgi:hypothetical protein